MRVFLSVAELRSFAAAARQLQLSPSAVTRHVAELEQELGVPLLVRTTRRVSLTRSGEDYAKSAKPILEDIEAANARARETQGALTGDLRLSAPLSLGIRLLPPALARFRTMHPELRLSLNLTDRFVDVAGEGFDMALRVSGPPTDKSNVWRKISVACSSPRPAICTSAARRASRAISRIMRASATPTRRRRIAGPSRI
jgi:DNA-binding transcriptional LysR family regulator